MLKESMQVRCRGCPFFRTEMMLATTTATTTTPVGGDVQKDVWMCACMYVCMVCVEAVRPASRVSRSFPSVRAPGRSHGGQLALVRGFRALLCCFLVAPLWDFLEGGLPSERAQRFAAGRRVCIMYVCVCQGTYRGVGEEGCLRLDI